MARAWNWQKWGRSHDLIHKSDLNSLSGKFGCLEQFKRGKEERATKGPRRYEKANGKLCAGNAVHSVIHRVLRSEVAVKAMLDPTLSIGRMSLETAFNEEFEKERAGRPIDWWKVNEDKWRDECVSMLFGLFEDMHNHVAEVVLVEAGFVFQIDGIWLTGSTDLVYRAPGSKQICVADWKTGAQKPHQIELDHGWEAGIYGNACKDAWFIPYANVKPLDGQEHREAMERECTKLAQVWQNVLDKNTSAESLSKCADAVAAVRFDEYPNRIRHVHLRDYIPYLKASSRMLERPEELEWAGLKEKEKHKFEKGDIRGPAWYRVQRAESDTPRLRHLLKAVVSWVRFGRFPAAPGEMCTRCKFREPCLVDGYQPIGEDKRQLEMLINRFESDGFDGLDEV